MWNKIDLSCPKCNGELTNAGIEPNGSFRIFHFKCLRCQSEFVQEETSGIVRAREELTEVREVEPELISEENEEDL